MKKNKVIVILGPTAIGKSDLGIKLALKYNGEIISGDSMQVYKGLDIGTAKISKQEQELVKHYLIDICEVTESYSVKNFQAQANDLIEQISASDHLPIVVGGTGFYLNALIKGMHLGGDDGISETALRAELEQKNTSELYELLKENDPQSAATIDAKNKRRLIRAIEVNQLTNQTFSNQVDQPNENNEFLLIGLTDDREKVYQRINSRVDAMFEQGLEAEAKMLFNKKEQVPQAQMGIGYKELFGYFEEEYPLEEAERLIKRNTRRFAKRQMTYFNNQMSVDWFDIRASNYLEKIEKKVNLFLEK
ncbi:tRNA (adenosine(37)-N6)-dimethylallyltransferase MiaA [Lactobacillus sp. YT155]|uniref:tRNA (adenosine(37)-N6)-dimethylallyltransferase MiaA n=1 Tax=Lactobacillus sp. YT155 TaxID=3060955 RepID=UPI00265FAD7A|nr:tRNA (adenosine(37)-N6)-dimethylallyltransferase MiaA [Lactobacillus sp. YT155]MDO1605571.1 tRNA (adenosine(37)-N6)-dimethylallyltransferase MiaA [Lactobacillus sp. YT155]